MAQWNRRQFLSGLLTAAGVEAAAVVEAHPLTLPASSQPPPGQRQSSAGQPPVLATDGGRALGEVLPEGIRFGRWRVVVVHPVKCGAVPVVLETLMGERFQVDVLARDRRLGARGGVAQTRHYSLHLSNIGRGSKPTHEEHGLGVLWLAALLRAREGSGSPARLLTMRDRLLCFPSGRFDVLHGSAPERSSPPQWGPIRTQSNARIEGARPPGPGLMAAAAPHALTNGNGSKR